MGKKLVVDGAKLKCDQGTSPGSLTVLPAKVADSDENQGRDGQPLPPHGEHLGLRHVPDAGQPAVAAATAAAQGVLTPQPCIPVTTSAWSPGSTT